MEAPSPVSSEQDWTRGPAKWLAAVVLGAAAIGGLGWSIWTQSSAGAASSRQPAGVKSAERAGATVAGSAASTSAAPASATDTKKQGPLASTAGPTLSSVINLNTASEEQLQLLPGIGPSLARRIIEHREKFGRFGSVDELDRVKGIGPKIIERVRSLVSAE